MHTIDVTYNSTTGAFTFAGTGFTGQGEYCHSDGEMQVDIPSGGSLELQFDEASGSSFTFVGIRVVPNGTAISQGIFASHGTVQYNSSKGIQNTPFSVALSQLRQRLTLTDAGQNQDDWSYCLRINNGTSDVDDDPKIYNRDQ